MDITPWSTILDSFAGSITPSLANDPEYQNAVLQKQGYSPDLPQGVKYQKALSYTQPHYGMPTGNLKPVDYAPGYQNQINQKIQQELILRDQHYPHIKEAENRAYNPQPYEYKGESLWPTPVEFAETQRRRALPNDPNIEEQEVPRRTTNLDEFETLREVAPPAAAAETNRFITMPLQELQEFMQRPASSQNHALAREAFQMRTRPLQTQDDYQLPRRTDRHQDRGLSRGTNYFGGFDEDEAQRERQAWFEQARTEMEERKKELEAKLKQAEEQQRLRDLYNPANWNIEIAGKILTGAIPAPEHVKNAAAQYFTQNANLFGM